MFLSSRGRAFLRGRSKRFRPSGPRSAARTFFSASALTAVSDIQRITMMPGERKDQYRRNFALAVGSVVAALVSVRKIDSARTDWDRPETWSRSSRIRARGRRRIRREEGSGTPRRPSTAASRFRGRSRARELPRALPIPPPSSPPRFRAGEARSVFSAPSSHSRAPKMARTTRERFRSMAQAAS